MKTNVQVKDEPVEFQVNELLRLYGYNLANQSSIKNSRTKSIVNQEQEPSTCAWCQKLGVRSFTLRTDSDDSKTLCSEVCFNQYRRASFKKNKNSESDNDHNPLPVVSTIKTKLHTNNNKSAEKKNGTNKYEHQSNDINRRKIILPLRRPTPTLPIKPKSNGITRKFSTSPPSKRHRSTSSSSTPPPSPSPSNKRIARVEQSIPSSNLPVSLTWQPSLVLPTSIAWPSAIDVNRFQYPFFVPPPPLAPPPTAPPTTSSLIPPLPPPLPSTTTTIPITSSDTPSSNLFTTLLKGTLSNFTCILPTFIPLPIPIPIPLCFPIQIPHTKCSVEVNDQECQTIFEDNIKQKLIRRLSI